MPAVSSAVIQKFVHVIWQPFNESVISKNSLYYKQIQDTRIDNVNCPCTPVVLQYDFGLFYVPLAGTPVEFTSVNLNQFHHAHPLKFQRFYHLVGPKIPLSLCPFNIPHEINQGYRIELLTVRLTATLRLFEVILKSILIISDRSRDSYCDNISSNGIV